MENRHNRQGIPDLIDPSTGKATGNCTEKAEILNKYFANVFTHEPDITTEYVKARENLPTLASIVIVEEQVSKSLLKIDISKSPGADNVHPRVLKEANVEISGMLCDIFNTSIKNGKLPYEWKTADITALYKKR